MKKILIIFLCLFSVSIFSQEVEILEATTEIVPSQGFSFKSMWRGVLGMIVLIVIAFLFFVSMFVIFHCVECGER